MYFDVSLWCTIQVVTTKDLLHFRTVEQHVDITAYKGFDGSYCVLCLNTMLGVCRYSGFRLSAKTATKGIAIDGAGIEVDIRSLILIEHQVFCWFARIGITQCRTAIYITVDDSCSSIDRSRVSRLCTDIHRYTTIHQCRNTLTATKDNVFTCIS